MNIAHILPYSARFPVIRHNGRYEWVLRLATLQAAHGNRVTIYSAPESFMAIPHIHWQSTSQSFGDRQANNLALFRQAFSDPTIDIFHSHFDQLHYAVEELTNKPIIATQHWFPNTAIAKAAKAARRVEHVQTVPVTKYMAAVDRQLGIPATSPIYHGIDLEFFRYASQARSDRFVYIGRVTAHKGVREAVLLAKQTGIKLDIIGKVNTVDEPYWQSMLPLVDGTQVRYLGPCTQSDLVGYMQRAKALLFPNQKPEAFGQTIIEAQACGLPVIVSDLAGSNELVADTVSGFTAKNTAAFIAAIKYIDQIKSEACRAKAEQFNILDTYQQYETLYAKSS